MGMAASNNSDIWTPLLKMLTLGHLSTACCIMLILPWAEIPWLGIDLKTLSSSVIFFGPLLAAPLSWSLDKEVSSFLVLILVHLCWEQHSSVPWPANLSFIQFSLRWLVSLQYQHSRSRFKDLSASGVSWDGLGFLRPGLLTNPVPFEASPPLPVGRELIFRLVVTA